MPGFQFCLRRRLVGAILASLCVLLAACTPADTPSPVRRPTALAVLTPVGWRTPEPAQTAQATGAEAPTARALRAFAGWGSTRAMAWTAQNELLLGTAEGLLVYDAATLTLRRSVPWPARAQHIVFGADGAYAALDQRSEEPGASDATVALWWFDVARGEARNVLSVNGCARALAFSPGGEWLAYGCDPLALWDGHAATPAVRIDNLDVYSRALAFSRDGRRLAAGDNWRVIVWDVEGRRRVTTLTPRSEARAMQFAAGDTLAVLDDEKVLSFWDVSQPALPAQVQLQGDRPWFAFSADGTSLATGGRGVALRDPATGAVRLEFDQLANAVVDDAVFSPDGQTLALLQGATITFWDVVTGRPRAGRLEDATPRVIWLSCGEDRLLALGAQGQVRVLDPFAPAALPQAAWPLEQFEWWNGVDGLVADPAQELVAAWHADALVARHSLDGTAVFSTTLPAGQYVTRAAAARIRPDGMWPLATLHQDNVLRLWDASTGRVLAEREAGRPAARIALSAGGLQLAAAYQDGGITLWDAARWQPERALPNPPAAILTATVPLTRVAALDFAPGGAPRLAAAFQQGVIRLWNTVDGHVVATWPLPDHAIPSNIAWSQDGQWLAVEALAEPRRPAGPRAYVLDAGTGRVVAQWPMQTLRGKDLAFCEEDGRPVLALVSEGQVELWDVP